MKEQSNTLKDVCEPRACREQTLKERCLEQINWNANQTSRLVALSEFEDKFPEAFAYIKEHNLFLNS